MKTRPPRPAQRLLARSLPEASREAVLGDLEEEYYLAARSRLWYWRHALALAASFLWERLRLARPPRPRGRPADSLRQDVRFALRSLAKAPGLALVAALTLALGVGANTAIFSIVHAVLLRPLPYPEPGRLVLLHETHAAQGRGRAQPSPGNFLDYRAQVEVFDGVAAWYQTSRTLRDAGAAAQVTTAQVAGDFFRTLGVAPALGRAFTPDGEPGATFNMANIYSGGDRVAVMSHAFWRRGFGGDPGIVGRDVLLDGQSWRVLAVMPASFAFPDPGVDLWLPWDLARSYAGKGFADGPPRDFRFLNVIARLGPGVTRERAQERMAAVAAGLAERHPRDNQGWGVRLAPLADELVRDARPALLVLCGAVGCVLLISCANVAGLLLARAAGRRHEMAVRAALGASRPRLVRQLLTESVVLAVAGGAAGLLLASAGLGLLVSLAPADIPRLDEVRIDATVLSFTLGVAVWTGVVFGLAPALQGSRVNLTSGLKEGGGKGGAGGRARHRMRGLLVVSELAIALVLLVGAGLFARSFARILAVDPGFDPRNLLVMRVFLNTAAYGSGAKSHQYYQQLLARLGALPGVTAVAATTVLPMSDVGIDFYRPYWRGGEADPGGQAPKAGIRMVTPEYFQTMGIPVRAGRPFTASDRADAPAVVMVNEELARQVWPAESPVGRRLVIDYKGGKYPYEVVGVAGDTRYYGLKSRPQPEIFIPHAQNPYLALNVVVRGAADPLRLAKAVEREALALDPAQPLHSVVTMDQLMAEKAAPDRFAMTLLGLLAVIALLLAAVGIYGLASYLAGQRTHEIGVRLALGAAPHDVFRLLLGESLRLAALGLALGMVAAACLARLVAGLLYEVSAADPLTFAAVAVILGGVSLLAALLPARRAMRVDPISALRYE